MPAMKPIRTLIIDDNKNFINAIATYLSAEPSLEIVGFAGSGVEAEAELADAKPDLVLMDYRLAETNGIDVMKNIRALPDPPRVIILSLEEIPAYREAARAAGAAGFVAKADLSEQLIPLIEALFSLNGTSLDDDQGNTGFEKGN
jgi:DNA-binding NarL/FixJ family response regulator